MKWILAVLIFFTALATGGWYVIIPKFKPQPPQWRTEKVTRGDIVVIVTSTGTVAPLNTVMVGAQISGKVKEVLKVSNEAVKKDDVLARLDPDLLDADKKSAEVHLGQARAALMVLEVERENLKIRELRQTDSIEHKRISIERARGARDLATKNLKRYKDLFKVDATTQTELDIRELEEANSQRDMRLMEIDLAEAQIDAKQIVSDGKQLDAKQEQARADVMQAEAALNRTITNLHYATIVSPIDGVVLQHLVEPGQTIAASFQTPNMFKIASDLKKIRIDAQLDEADIGKIKIDQEVTFDVDAYREDFKGKVAMIRLQSETKGNLVTYPVLVEADNPPDKEHVYGKLLPGMTASLRFVVDKHPNVLKLPAAALRFIPPPNLAPPKDPLEVKDTAKTTGTRGIVFVADALGKLSSRNVRVGENDGDNYELLESDLHEGDEVVLGQKF